ncbi:MAG: sodium:solute symporter family protein [Bacteroidota bacterium]
MSATDLSVTFVFTLLVFICGISFSKAGGSMKSYFAAGGALPWWISGLSLFMSFFSAGTFVVWGSIAYSSGWVAVTIQWTMAIAGIIIGFLIAPKWQQTKALTAAEFIRNRLGETTQKTYTYLFLGISIFTTGAFLYPVAKIVEVSTGIPIATSIIVLGTLILIYTAVGGLWAVIVTDVLQFIVLTAAVFMVVPLAFQKIGGIQCFISKAPERFFELTNSEYSWVFMIAFGLYNLFFIAGNWAYVQRYTSVATQKDAKKVGWLFGGLYVISPVIWMLPPMIYRVLNPELVELADEGAYLLMCKEVLPLGILGLMLGGMVFATSSSVNTTLNISAGVLTNDLYRSFFPETSDKKLMRIAKLATVGLGVLTIIIALLVPYLGGIVEVVMSLAALTGGAMFLPPLWALFSKRQTGKTALLVTVVSLTINGFFKFFAPDLIDVTFDRATEMVVGMGVPIVMLAIIERLLIQSNNSTEAFEAYERIRDSKENETTATETSEENGNRRGTRVIGTGITATGLLILMLGFMGDTGQWLVRGMGLIVLSLGAFIIKKSRNS